MSTPGFRLEPADEYPHVPDASPHYNESVYANAFDAESRLGGWMRLGNRVNEGAAELSVCLYLPDGRLACQFQRPSITTNARFDAGGLSFEVQEPLRAVSMAYEGEVFLLEEPGALRDPRRAFERAARAPCRVRWLQTSVSPAHGGEPLTPEQRTPYGPDFSRGHFNLHTRVRGEVVIGGAAWRFDGHGWRDHSWGPRYWQNLYAHRLLTVGFGDDLGLMLHKVEDRSGAVRRVGTLLEGGRYTEVEDLDLVIDWTPTGEPRGARVGFRAGSRREVVDVRVLSLAPLRNRRKVEGQVLESRILEAACEFRLGGRVGLGMFELVENVEDGRPVGFPL